MPRKTVNTLSLEEMEIGLARFFSYERNIIVPNVSFGLISHECDILIVQPSGWAIEVEIKRSKGDTKADLQKNHQHRSNKIRALYFAFPLELYESCKDLVQENAGILVLYKNEYGYIRVECRRPPKKNTLARKLTEIEIKQAMRLGCLRIWKLKQRINNIEEWNFVNAGTSGIDSITSSML